MSPFIGGVAVGGSIGFICGFLAWITWQALKGSAFDGTMHGVSRHGTERFPNG